MILPCSPDPVTVDKSRPFSLANFLANGEANILPLEGAISDSTKPLLVIYTSPSCGPCHVLKPQLKRVLSELEGQAQGIEIDIEAEQAIAEQAGVNGTPTVQLFHAKELKQQWRGVKQRSEFKAAIEACLQAAV